MSKRLVEIDDALLEDARRATGATTIRATVETALRRIVEDDTTLRHIRWLRANPLDPDLLAESRAPRFVVDD